MRGMLTNFFLFQTELTKSTGVFIPTARKNQIKVDNAHRPYLIARDALFTLFGRNAFKTATVTARGKGQGTFGISPEVLEAVLGWYIIRLTYFSGCKPHFISLF